MQYNLACDRWFASHVLSTAPDLTSNLYLTTQSYILTNLKIFYVFSYMDLACDGWFALHALSTLTDLSSNL